MISECPSGLGGSFWCKRCCFPRLIGHKLDAISLPRTVIITSTSRKNNSISQTLCLRATPVYISAALKSLQILLVQFTVWLLRLAYVLHEITAWHRLQNDSNCEENAK